jgi:hypothetical protein
MEIDGGLTGVVPVFVNNNFREVDSPENGLAPAMSGEPN